MKRYVFFFVFLLSPLTVFASPVTDKVAELQAIYDEGRTILATYWGNPSLYPHLTPDDVVHIAGIVNQAGVYLNTFYTTFGGVEQPGNPVFDSWVTGSLDWFFQPGGYGDVFENIVNPVPPLPSGDVVIPVSIPDFDYGGMVMSLLGVVSVIAVVGIGLGLSVWGIPYLFSMFTQMSR